MAALGPEQQRPWWLLGQRSPSWGLECPLQASSLISLHPGTQLSSGQPGDMARARDTVSRIKGSLELGEGIL